MFTCYRISLHLSLMLMTCSGVMDSTDCLPRGSLHGNVYPEIVLVLLYQDYNFYWVGYALISMCITAYQYRGDLELYCCKASFVSL